MDIACVTSFVIFLMNHATLIFRYGFPDLVADIGGYLGFFLGASILSLFDQAVELMLSCWRKMEEGKAFEAKVTKSIS